MIGRPGTRAGDPSPTTEPPRRRKRSRLRYAARIAAVILATCLAFTWSPAFQRWSWRSSGGFFGTGIEDPTCGEIERVARIALPPGATDVRAAVGGFQDPWALVRFRLPADQVPRFLKGLRYPMTVNPGGSKPEYVRNDPHRPWWKPGAARHFREGRCVAPSFVQSILIDEDDPDRSVVFIDSQKM